MASSEATDALAQVIAAPGPASVHTAPSKWPLVALVLAGPFVSAMLVFCIWVLAFVLWDGAMMLGSEDIATRIVVGVSTIATALAIILGLIVFRLASGGLRSVSARALSGSLEIRTGDVADNGD